MNNRLRIYTFLLALICALPITAQEIPSENPEQTERSTEEITCDADCRCPNRTIIDKVLENTIYSLSQAKRMISHSTIAAIFGLTAGKLDKYMESKGVFPNAGLQLGLLVNLMLAVNGVNLAHRGCCQTCSPGDPTIEYLVGFGSFLAPYLTSYGIAKPIERWSSLFAAIKNKLS